MLQCDNAACKSKSKRVMVRRGYAMRPWLWPQVPTRLHKSWRRGTQGFSSEKFTKVHHGNLQGRNRFGSRSQLLPRQAARTPRRRNPRQGPAGRGRQVRLGLSRRRRSAHLRRFLQAGHHPARAGAPRAGCRACGRRLCARHGRRGRGAGHLRSRRDQCRHRHRHGLHGQHSDGDHHRPGADGSHRPGRLPGVRHRRHHAPHRQAQLPGQGRARPGRDHEEGLPHRPQRPPRPGGGGHPQGCVVQEGAVRGLPRVGGDALLQPGAQGPWRPDPQGACNCC